MNMNKFTSLELALKENCELTEKALASFFEDKSESGCLGIIMQAEKYSLLGGGKRIRAFLVNEVARMFGGDLSASMPFAAAVEMIHAYSLIHDDLPCMDDDDFRRGKPSNHKVYGEAYALLAGDALLTNAFLALTKSNVPVSVLAEAVDALSRAAGDEGMIGGQVTDLEGEGRELSFDELLTLHSLKTGKMIEVSALLGCLAAGKGADDEITLRVCAYARAIGVVFQAVDDLLDVIGDEGVVGKTLSDKENNKTTFLSFFDIEGVKDYATRLTEQAISEIETIEKSDTLKELAWYLLERNK
jgi:geranylgeranyl pyrophosphate synthase